MSQFPENCDCPGGKGPCFFPASPNSHFPDFLYGQVPSGQTQSEKGRALCVGKGLSLPRPPWRRFREEFYTT